MKTWGPPPRRLARGLLRAGIAFAAALAPGASRPIVIMVAAAAVLIEDVSTLVGDGPGRGWAVVVLAAAVLAALVVLVAFRSLQLRRQDDLPDVTPEERLAQAAPGASMPVGVTASAPDRR